MISKRNIFLIGPMGSGKTAVGRQLARLFRLSFYDSDADIEAKTGVDIAFIFEKEEGDVDAGFRLDICVAIVKAQPEQARELATDGRLARAHGSDEKDIALRDHDRRRS